MSSNPIVGQLFGTGFSDDKKKKQEKKKIYQNAYENPVEAFKHLGKGLGNEVKQQSQDAVKEAWKMLLGGDKLFHGKSGGDLHPGQELNLSALKKDAGKQAEKVANVNIRPAMDYVGEVLKAGENQSAKETAELKQQVQSLMVELRALSGSAKGLEKQVMEATGSAVINPGKYHKTFLQHVMSIVRDARSKIDNAGTWLSAFKGKQNKRGTVLLGGAGKKKKKGNYWDMAKKHGASFTQSGERAIASSG